ncbi:hypothetical protein VTN77DRAFT_3172 [Rasamsonia byssochlamydoides]|uniref:uncharacterized protein n=1 Tax=Rasamsonia byssochlamydoides TaxID=89139 RepID=UPI0037446E1F
MSLQSHLQSFNPVLDHSKSISVSHASRKGSEVDAHTESANGILTPISSLPSPACSEGPHCELLPQECSQFHTLRHSLECGTMLVKEEHGWSANAAVRLPPELQICYYPGKLHGGILAFILDQVLVRCCDPALTAKLEINFRNPVPPGASMIGASLDRRSQRAKN